jgi:hypothetical protein
VKRESAERWERIRRLRYGALLRLFRHRWGHVLPDDDAGRDDLWLLVTNASLAVAEPQKKMRHVIEMWAPWMSSEEREAYGTHVWGLDRYERIQTGEEIGKRLGLTNADREALKLWPFKPIDRTDEELAELKRERERARRERKRRQRGMRTREAYLADLASKSKPWIAEGISRTAYYRKRKRDGLSPGARRGESEIIVFKHRTHGVARKAESPKKGCQGVVVENPSNTTGAGEVEKNESSSPEQRTGIVSPQSSTMDARLRALERWGANAKREPDKTNGHFDEP